MRTASLISILIGISLLITVIFTLMWGKEIAFYLLLLGLSIMAIGMAGGIIYEERKKLIDTEKICAICGRGIPLDAETCQYCWNKASKEIEMFRHYRNI
jgi:hypothetical protein